MTVEEALVALLAIAALVLLFLGLAEALEARPAGRASRRHLAEPLDEAGPGLALEAPARRPEPSEVPVPPATTEPPPSRPSPFARRPLPPARAPGLAALGPSRLAKSTGEAAPGPEPMAMRAQLLPGIAEAAARIGAAPALEEPESKEPDRRPAPIDDLALAAEVPVDAPRDAPLPPGSTGAAGWEGLPWASAPLSEPSGPAGESPGAADPEAAILDRCAVLYLGGKHHELLTVVDAHLAALSPRAGETGPGPALSSLAGLSRWELGDRDAARPLMMRAVEAAAPPESCPPRLAALALPLARRLLEAAEPEPGGQGLEARVARFWLRWRLVAAPEDPDALALLDAADAALGAAVGEDVAGCLRARDWSGARRAIDAAAGRGDVDVVRAQMLDRMVLSAVKREVERLVTPAIRGARDERRAVEALAQAEDLLTTLPADVLGASHRAALGRRVAWAHARLGIQRVRSGSQEAGADALVQALGVKGLGPERLRRVREVLVEALEGLATRAAGALGEPGGQEAAATLARELEVRIERARTLGVPARLLAPVEERVARLTGEPAADPGS